jgi:hypothetical protein
MRFGNGFARIPVQAATGEMASRPVIQSTMTSENHTMREPDQRGALGSITRESMEKLGIDRVRQVMRQLDD